MTRRRIDRKFRRWLLAACAGLVLIAAAGVSLATGVNSAETASPDKDYTKTAGHHEPATLEPIEGTDVKRVSFSAEGAARVGLQTASVSEDGQQKVVPYAAVLYDSEGDTFTYTSPERLTYVRVPIKVDQADGDQAVLSDGPPVGTQIVTVGAAEVYGAEFEVAH